MLISPQLTEHNRAVVEEKNLQVNILSDPGNRVAADYGLRYTIAAELKELYTKFGIDIPAYNGDDSWSLPLPARLIIDGGGVVRYAAINVDYTRRPDPEETLAALRQLE